MKKLIAMLLALVMILGLAACGAKEEAAVPTETEAAAPTETEASAPVETEAALAYEGVTLTYWTRLTDGTPQAETLKELAAEFTANTGAVLDIKFNGADHATLLQTALESKENIDIFDIASVTALANNNLTPYCYDLTEMAEAVDYTAKTYPLYIEKIIETSGYLSGVVADPSINGIWYNEAIFADCGITAVPSTIEELEAACDAMLAKGYSPWALDSGYSNFNFGVHLERYTGEEVAKELSLNGGWSENEKAVEAAQVLVDWVNKGYYVDGAPDEWPNSQNKMGLTEDVAMIYCGSWIGAEIENNTGADIDWGYMPYPAEPTGDGTDDCHVYSALISINAESANPQAAFDFLMYIKAGDGDQRYSDAAGLPPCDISNEELPDFTNVKQSILDAEVSVDANGGCLANADMKAAIKEVIVNIFSGKYASGAEAMAAMDELYK